MTVVVLDANILLRTVDLSAPLRPVAMAAVTVLRTRGDTPTLVPQSLYELWVVATRPQGQNGLGFTPAQCLAEIATLKTYYPLLLDLPTLYAEWETLVATHACVGKPAHDARYVAAMRTHGLTHILTFNGPDFQRFPGITVLDPHVVAASASTGSP
jgi:predicted nucleic acid-binding protein